MSGINRIVIMAQGAYYVITGSWPLVSYATFEAITGPKTDKWLVHTVGLLLVAVGAALLTGARRASPSAETLVLAAASACAFIAIEIFYVARSVIGPIYLADAVLQVCMLALYGWVFMTGRQRASIQA